MTNSLTSKPVLSDDIEYDKSGAVRVKPEAMLRRVKEYIAAHKEDDTKAPASNSSAAVLRSWSGVVVDRNLSSDLAIAADEIERLQYERDVWRSKCEMLAKARSASEPPSDRHRLELRLAFDKWMATRDPQALSEIAMLINAVCGATVTKSGDQKSTTGAERGERSRGLGEQQNGESLVVSAPPPVAGVTECGACDKPGEHCSNIYGICSRHGGHPPRTSGETSECLPADPYNGKILGHRLVCAINDGRQCDCDLSGDPNG